MIRFSEKKWWAIEQSSLFGCWRAIYKKVFFCFYKHVGDLPVGAFSRCKNSRDIDNLLEQTFQTKGE